MKDKDSMADLKRANSDLLALYDINRLLQTQLPTEEKLYIILTSLTADDAFGYSRAYLLLINDQQNTLEGWLGVGELKGDEAREIWEGVTALEEEDTAPGRRNIAELLERAPFDIKVRSFVVPVLRGQGHPVQTVINRRPKLIKDIKGGKEPLHPDFEALLSSNEIAIIPMLSKNRVMGVIAVESPGGDCPIDEKRLRTLTVFGNLAAIALENSKLYHDLEEKVSTLEKVNRELQEAQAKILQLDRLASMGAIAAGVAHEIKNPLNSLFINIHLLKDEVTRPEARKLMEVVEKETERLSDTVIDFLNYSKLPKPSLALAHPHRVLDSVLEMVEFQGMSMGVSISREYNHKAREIMLDENRMKQAFLNVIINALQAMPGGGVLTVRTGIKNEKENPTCFYIQFRDTGYGIPKDCMDRLFDPFFTTKEEGTGMGLPIVDSILRSHGGRVNIESAPGQGTTVTLRIPLADVPVS
ncbi:MAG: GAF domain-containing sensor histidine kinase [Nitrospirota bacterium]